MYCMTCMIFVWWCHMMSQLNHMSNHFHRFPPGSDKADETIDIQKDQSEPSSGCATYHLIVSTPWLHKHQWQLISDMPMLPMWSSYDVHNMFIFHPWNPRSILPMTLLIFVPLWQATETEWTEWNDLPIGTEFMAQEVPYVVERKVGQSHGSAIYAIRSATGPSAKSSSNIYIYIYI